MACKTLEFGRWFRRCPCRFCNGGSHFITYVKRRDRRGNVRGWKWSVCGLIYVHSGAIRRHLLSCHAITNITLMSPCHGGRDLRDSTFQIKVSATISVDTCIIKSADHFRYDMALYFSEENDFKPPKIA